MQADECKTRTKELLNIEVEIKAQMEALKQLQGSYRAPQDPKDETDFEGKFEETVQQVTPSR